MKTAFVSFCLFYALLQASIFVSARPATFLQDFRATWSEPHIKQIEGGRAIQLILDQNSGCGFASKYQYLFGRVSMKIKLIPGDSAGTVTAFYMNSDTDNVRDELDFEFLGNRTGQPYTVQTNVYAHGKGDREQRINLWFDPAADFHTYSILWNHRQVVFYVDEVPVRVYKNNEAKGIPFPKFQPMGVYSTLWEADDWATRGGLEKIDWSKAPFYAYYKDFDIEGCPVPGPSFCPSNTRNWWESAAYQQLSAVEAKRYEWFVGHSHMARYPSSMKTAFVSFCLFYALLQASIFVSARPATFLQDFRATWSEPHIKQIEGGRAIQLILDQNSGCGFASKYQYLFGRVSMKIKLIPGDSAGTVTAFYMNSDTDNVRDELDFEFLGNRTGQPYTVQTNVYAHGKGDREQRINLWFDPAADYHTYSILWNHHHVVFYVDEVPVRVYKNNEAKGIPFPKFQPMGVYSTLWEADDWATRGGLEKIDWSKAPFYAYYKDFDIEGCPVPGPSFCPSNTRNWWESAAYQQLSAVEAKRYEWVRMNHMTYDYCNDKSRYPITPPECI